MEKLFFILLFFLLVVGVGELVLFLRLRRLEKMMSEVFVPARGKESLQEVVYHHVRRTAALQKEVQELYDFVQKVHALGKKGLYRVGIVRFNPFHDIGGDQSFALAFLDGERNGVVLSTLYTKEGTRIFAKPVSNGVAIPPYHFTEEEKKALAQASSKKTKGFIPTKGGEKVKQEGK